MVQMYPIGSEGPLQTCDTIRNGTVGTGSGGHTRVSYPKGAVNPTYQFFFEYITQVDTIGKQLLSMIGQPNIGTMVLVLATAREKISWLWRPADCNVTQKMF